MKLRNLFPLPQGSRTLVLLFLVLAILIGAGVRYSSGAENITEPKSVFAGLKNVLSDLTSIVLSLVLILVLALLGAVLIKWLRTDPEIVIHPFDIATGENKYSGQAFSHMFIAGWQKISEFIAAI